MSTSPTAWTVLQHDPPVQLADNLWSVEGDLPNMALRRRMTVARLRDGGLVIHNAIALDDGGLAWLLALGAPRIIVIPNGWHRLDGPRYAARFPEAKVVCPAGSRARIERVARVDATYDDVGDVSGDGTVVFEHLDGTKNVEGVMLVRSSDGLTAIFNDCVFNLAHMPGLFGFVYGKLLGNAGRPKVTMISKLLLLKQRGAFRDHLLRIADLPGLVRAVPGHGDVIAEAAPDVVRAIANGI